VQLGQVGRFGCAHGYGLVAELRKGAVGCGSSRARADRAHEEGMKRDSPCAIPALRLAPYQLAALS